MPGDSTRRTVLAAAAATLAGCSGGDRTPTPTRRSTGSPDNPAVGDVEETGDLRLTSPAFEDGDPIPDEYGRGERNVNPPLSVANVPRTWRL